MTTNFRRELAAAREVVWEEFSEAVVIVCNQRWREGTARFQSEQTEGSFGDSRIERGSCSFTLWTPQWADLQECFKASKTARIRRSYSNKWYEIIRIRASEDADELFVPVRECIEDEYCRAHSWAVGGFGCTAASSEEAAGGRRKREHRAIPRPRSGGRSAGNRYSS